jgi:hypothetical protein
MSALNHVPPSLTRFRDAYERVLPELEALPEAAVLGINIDLPQAVTVALGALKSIAGQREAIARALPEVDLAHLDKLETYALAAGHAHAAFMAASTVLPMKELAAQAVRLRQLLCSDAGALAKRGLIDGRRLSALNGPQGHLNLAFDLLALVALFRERWADVRSKTAVEASELDAAEVVADQLIARVNARMRPAPMLAVAADRRRRAFTLFVSTYDEVRRAISFLRWKHGDADSFVPSLYAGRSSGRRRARERDPRSDASGIG